MLEFTRRVIIDTFCFNSKSSLLKLLCTLVRLFEGTPLQPLILDFFLINFPLHPRSKLLFFTFCGQDNKGESAQSPQARYYHQTAHPRDIETHPISHVYTSKVSSTPRHAIPQSPRASGITFSLHFAKPFLQALTLFSLFYCIGGRERTK